MENVSLSFTEDALHAIAVRAIGRKTGARGLRSILESILLDTMFEMSSYEDIDEVIINKEVVEGHAQPLKTYGKRLNDASKG